MSRHIVIPAEAGIFPVVVDRAGASRAVVVCLAGPKGPGFRRDDKGFGVARGEPRPRGRVRPWGRVRPGGRALWLRSELCERQPQGLTPWPDGAVSRGATVSGPLAVARSSLRSQRARPPGCRSQCVRPRGPRPAPWLGGCGMAGASCPCKDVLSSRRKPGSFLGWSTTRVQVWLWWCVLLGRKVPAFAGMTRGLGWTGVGPGRGRVARGASA
jgi:hypothetical protein